MKKEDRINIVRGCKSKTWWNMIKLKVWIV